MVVASVNDCNDFDVGVSASVGFVAEERSYLCNHSTIRANKTSTVYRNLFKAGLLNQISKS